MAVAISREHAYNNPSIPASHIYCFKNSQIIYDYALHFFVRKNFTHLDNLNEFILMASATGLIDRWRSVKKEQTRTQSSEEPIGITSDVFLHGTLIFSSLYILFPMTLLIEKLVYTRVHMQNSSKVWKFLEMVINSERYFMRHSNCFWK